MTDENVETAPEVVEDTVKEEPVKKAPRKRATKKAAESVEAVENVSVQEATVGPVENVITFPEKAHTDGPVRSNMKNTAEGVIGSVAADRVFEKPKAAAPKKEVDSVALWSDKNIRWTGVGALIKGYNIVTKEAAEKWLTKGAREATPEEVAAHYGK